MDGAEEVGCGFIVACGDASELFEFGEEVLYQGAPFVKFLIVWALVLAVGFGRDDDIDARFLQKGDHAVISVEGFVGEDRLDLVQNIRKQGIRTFQIVGLSRRQMEPCRGAQSGAARVDFGGQPAFAAPDGFV